MRNNCHIIAYDLKSFDTPALVIDYTKIKDIVKTQDFNKFTKMYEDLDMRCSSTG